MPYATFCIRYKFYSIAPQHSKSVHHNLRYIVFVSVSHALKFGCVIHGPYSWCIGITDHIVDP